MAQFYTMEEAARVLGMDPEELKEKAQKREIRAFLDGGSWQFRASDIDELARQRGMGSDPDLSLSDLEDIPGSASTSGAFDTSDDESDVSEFQLGSARPETGSQGSESVSQGSDSTSDEDILLDDQSTPVGGSSSSHIIGMEDEGGKRPSDSDVRLVPESEGQEGGHGPSDSDVQLSGEAAAASPPPPTEGVSDTGSETGSGSGSGSDSDVTLVQEEDSDSMEVFAVDASAEPKRPGDQESDSDPSGETSLRPSPFASEDDESESAADEQDSDSDFELTPSSVIDALEPESGSDFELTALDGSDEFDASAPKPSDSDVTGAEPESAGVNLGRPSDSGINLQSMGNLDESAELAPMDTDDSFEMESSNDPSATALPTKSPDPSATALPVGEQNKDIFDDTDFEVDAFDSGEDNTMQIEQTSDFDLDDDDSASEVFALDEEEVDQSAATAMGPAVLEGAGALEEIEEEGASDDEAMVGEAGWEESEDASEPVAAPAAPAGRRATGIPTEGPEWSGLWVGVLGVTAVFMMVLSFITMDVVRNLNTFHGETPVVAGLVRMIAGGE